VLITIIIPCYNCSKFVSYALKSIKESFKFPVEIIVVDDGSTDDSNILISKIIKENKYGNLKLITLKNSSGGPGRGRNEGIKHAKTEYIAFLDADDIFLPGLGEKIEEIIHKYMVDVIEFDFCRFSQTLKVNQKHVRKRYSFSGIINIHNYWNEYFAKTVWYSPIRVYKRNLWKKIHFPDGIAYEDMYTTPFLLDNTKNIYISNGIFYGYRFNDNSMTANPNIRHLKDLVNLCEKISDNKKFNILNIRTSRTIYEIAIKLGLSKNEIKLMYNLVYKIQLSLTEFKSLLLPDKVFYLLKSRYFYIAKFKNIFKKIL